MHVSNSLSNGSKEVGHYTSGFGSVMYVMMCTRTDICYALGMVIRYQSNLSLEHWIAVKYILKYLQRTRDLMLVYSGGELNPPGYTDLIFNQIETVESRHLDKYSLLVMDL